MANKEQVREKLQMLLRKPKADAKKESSEIKRED